MASSQVGPSRAISPAAGSSNRSGQRSLDGQGATAPAAAKEVILEGRRYRLVPLDEASAPRRGSAAASLLTGRELQIVSLVAEGRVNKQIADQLRISEWTVSTHLRRIFAKLGVDTRAAMVSRCADSLVRRDA